MQTKKKRTIKKEAVFGITVVSIPLLAYAIFHIVPLVIAIVTMFVEMKGYQLDTMAWNNFANFKEVFADGKFWLSLRNTLGLLIGQFLSLGIALITSTFLSQKYRGTKFFTALFFVPHICSSVAITIIWMKMFSVEFGVVNDVLMSWFGESAKVGWYNEAFPFFLMIFIIMLWQAPGYGIVMFNAAFTAISTELYEAASIDGAGKVQQFRYITLPSIRPTTFFLSMAGIISGLQAFNVPMLVSDTLGNSWTGAAGPDNAGLTTMLYVYNTGITFNNMPKAAVMSFFLFIIIMGLTIINFRIERSASDD